MVRQGWVIFCKWVGGGEAIVVLKDLKARIAADLEGLRAFCELSGFSSPLSARVSRGNRLLLGLGEDDFEKIVRERCVIICGWVGGGNSFVDLKELKARVAADLRGLRAFYELSAFGSQLSARVLRRIPLQLGLGQGRL